MWRSLDRGAGVWSATTNTNHTNHTSDASRRRLGLDRMVDDLELDLVGLEQALELVSAALGQALGVVIAANQTGQAEIGVLERCDGSGRMRTGRLAAPEGPLEMLHRPIDDELVEAVLQEGQKAAEPGAIGLVLKEPEPVRLVLQDQDGPVEEAPDDPAKPDHRKKAPQPAAYD
jgi:hypothetical protein